MSRKNWTGYNAEDVWRKFLVQVADPMRTPRRPKGMVSYGPDELGLRLNIVYEGGPDSFVRNNPQLFATSSTSRHEGFFYWALVKIIGKEGEYGKNGLIWQYQSKVRGAAGGPGGSVVDFVIQNTGGQDIGVRIVTPYYHTGAGPLKRGEDFEQVFTLLSNDVFVVDVYSVNYISDLTGRAAIKSATRAIGRQPDYSPLYRAGVYT